MIHVLLLLSCCAWIAVKCQNAQLQCNQAGTFKIIQFTDTHFGESTSNDQKSTQSFTELIGYESPDLIVLSGDFVSGYAYNGTHGWWKDTFDYGISPILASGIPWAYTLGNHDAQADWNRTQIISYASKLNNSKTFLGPSNIGGASNFVLTVMNNKSEAISNVWFMDSLVSNCYGVTGWGCVEFDEVMWYRNQSIYLENKLGVKASGIMYIHIPLPEVLNLWNNYETTGHGEDSGVCCWSLNTGLFSVFEQRQDISSVWHGHDHENDFFGNYHGITIGYGRKTGYGGYGPDVNEPRGARVIEFDCNKNGNFSWSTWIRENDGTKVTSQPAHKAGEWKRWTECCGSDGITNRNLLGKPEWRAIIES